MTLRNAFEEVATDSMVRRLLLSLNFARDINDRLRVVVDNVVRVTSTQYMANSSLGVTGAPLVLYDPLAVNMVDEREPARMQYRSNARRTMERWTY